MASDDLGDSWLDGDPVPLDPLLFADPADRPPPPAGPTAFAADRPCPACGYNLRGLPIVGTCPECGTAIDVVPIDESSDPHLIRRRVKRLRQVANVIRLGQLGIGLMAFSQLVVVTIEATPPTWVADALGYHWSDWQFANALVNYLLIASLPGVAGYTLLLTSLAWTFALDRTAYHPIERAWLAADRFAKYAVIAAAAVTVLAFLPVWFYGDLARRGSLWAVTNVPSLFGPFCWAGLLAAAWTSRRVGGLARGVGTAGGGDESRPGTTAAAPIFAATALTAARLWVYAVGPTPYNLSHVTAPAVASVGAAVAVAAVLGTSARQFGRWSVGLTAEIERLWRCRPAPILSGALASLLPPSPARPSGSDLPTAAGAIRRGTHL